MNHARLFSLAIGLVSVFSFAGGVCAQSTEPLIAAGLTVRGHGEIRAKPDVAHAVVTVTTSSRDQAQAVSDNSTTIHTVLAALKGATVSDKDVQTSYYSVQPQYDYRTSPLVLVGYQVTDSLRVTIHDLPKIGIILDKATRAGATSVDNITFDLSDRNRFVGDALALAVANARSKADLMAGAAGVELVRVVSVAEGTTPSIQPIRMMAAVASAPSGSAQPTPIQPADIDVEADATIVYSIQPHH
jgi:uncharacterized protein YggE